jgi:aminoglycoside phosphotransferase (APT) family kinase protein
MEIGELVGAGRSADVYALGDGRVLRRYRVDADAGRELEIMAHVAAHGFPVPEVFPGESSATDLVMGRGSGPPPRSRSSRPAGPAASSARTLAWLLRRLHRIPARVSRDPRDRILHLDLHPDNVMLTPDGPVVIDWCNAGDGRPALDCALSAVILAQAAVDGESELAPAARAAVAVLVGELGEDLDAGGPLDDAKARRAADRGLTAHEVSLLDEAVALIRRLAAPGVR